jgi:ribosomal protein S18 acetylase RimI-like enzyme
LKIITSEEASSLGIETMHHIMENGERRFRLVSSDGSSYIRTEGAADSGWQNSHYHKFVTELYVIQSGWIVYAELSDECKPVLRYYGPGDSFCVKPLTHHNIYMSPFAITHVVKYANQETERTDWFPSEELDKLTRHLTTEDFSKLGIKNTHEKSMDDIKEITNDQLKAEITEKILRALPEWFGNEEALLNYIETVKGKKFFCAYDGSDAVGFICIKLNNEYTADLYVTGILKEYHRKGIGRKLVGAAEHYLIQNGFRLFMVKTLGESSDYEFYRRTREFYRSIGFYPLEEFKEIWDEDNPCLIMVKSLER